MMAQNPDVRWRQRFQSFRKAFGQLSAAADLAKQRKLSELEQQGLIQAFEFTHELAWNTLKDFLEAHGAINLYGSKDATREAFARGLIANGDEWMAMIQARNRSSHTYNEKTAQDLAAATLSSFVPEFAAFLAKFTGLDKEET
jgi:nucleotidyltransferase substrate binding protein (TIGR01987 family)